VVLAPAGPAQATPTTVASGAWTAMADQAYSEASTAEAALEQGGQNIQVQYIAALAWYAGLRFGWTDTRTTSWLTKVYARRTASRGYGIGQAYDAFGNGTVNPANTTYTITTAWHVGRVLLAGYDAGAVPAARVTEAVAALLDTPQSNGGQCIAYSKHVNDANMPCVWNVSATAAWFVWRADQRGLVPAGREAEALDKLRRWRDDVRAEYRGNLGGWTYQSNTTALQDPWHNAPTVAAMYEADPTIGPTALAGHFGNWPNNTGANVDLLVYDCSRVDANYAAAHASATQPASTNLDKLATRAAYLAGPLRVQAACS
jgi:hypothetical protein